MGALREAIHAHGPITEENMGSACKRIVAQLRQAGSDHVVITADDESAMARALEHTRKKYQTLRFGHERALRRIANLEAQLAERVSA